MSNSSFLNGLIAGAGIVLAIMSYGFLHYVSPLENQQGISTTEIRVAIMLGGIVAAVSIGYEYYSMNETKKQTNESDDLNTESNESNTNNESNTKVQ